MASQLEQAIEEFRAAQREHAHAPRDPFVAESLRRARQRLDAEAAATLRGFPFSVYPVTPERHFAVREAALLREGRRVRGQTLCGAPSGYPPRGNPAPCTECLRVAERYLVHGPPPLELDLGL